MNCTGSSLAKHTCVSNLNALPVDWRRHWMAWVAARRTRSVACGVAEVITACLRDGDAVAAAAAVLHELSALLMLQQSELLSSLRRWRSHGPLQPPQRHGCCWPPAYGWRRMRRQRQHRSSVLALVFVAFRSCGIVGQRRANLSFKKIKKTRAEQ
jgi:hypothetical protein